jgi:tetratricopeptide (TPR) repeat protein
VSGDSSDRVDEFPSWIDEDIESIRKEDDALRTMEGSILGTPAFMAPEQAKDAASVGYPADVYAMGAVLYNILTLQPPVSGSSTIQIMMKVVKGEIEHPAAVSGSFVHCPSGRIPSSLSAVAMKALATDPLNRYGDIQELQDDVQAYLGGFATEAEEAGLGTQLKLLVHRHRAPFAGLAAAMAVIIVLVAGFIVSLQAEQKLTEDAQADTKEALAHAEKNLDLADQRFGRLEDTVPVFLTQASTSITQHDIEQALEFVDAALKIDPDNADAHNLRGNVLQTMIRLDQAIVAYRSATEHRLGFTTAIENAKLCERLIATAKNGNMATALALQAHMRSTGRTSEAMYLYASTTASLKARIPQWQAALSQANPHITIDTRGIPHADVMVGHNAQTLAGIEQLREMPIRAVAISSRRITDFGPLRQLAVECLDCRMLDNLTDLSPLKDLNLQVLRIGFYHSKPVDFGPLAGLPLRELTIMGPQFSDRDLPMLTKMSLETLILDQCTITDLSPLKDLRLKKLVLARLYPKSLEPLRHMHVESLFVRCSKSIGDLTPLRDTPLKALNIVGETDIEPLRDHPTLRTINIHPVKEFWLAYDEDKAKKAGQSKLPYFIAPGFPGRRSQVVKP